MIGNFCSPPTENAGMILDILLRDIECTRMSSHVRRARIKTSVLSLQLSFPGRLRDCSDGSSRSRPIGAHEQGRLVLDAGLPRVRCRGGQVSNQWRQLKQPKQTKSNIMLERHVKQQKRGRVCTITHATTSRKKHRLSHVYACSHHIVHEGLCCSRSSL